jgi:hypothetical protein
MAWASPTIDGDPGKMKNSTLILVYAGLAFGSSFFVAMRSIFVTLAGVFVAQKYFLDMIRCLFRAPMSFFDATPAGRILNRVCVSSHPPLLKPKKLTQKWTYENLSKASMYEVVVKKCFFRSLVCQE